MSRCDKSTWLVVSGCLPAPILLVSVASWIIMATEEHGAAPWTTSTESCVHVTPGGVATEEDFRAPRRPHNWSSELLWPYWKATEERPTTPHSPKPPALTPTTSWLEWWHVMIQ